MLIKTHSFLKIFVLLAGAGLALLAVPNKSSAASSLTATTPDLAPPTTVTITDDQARAWQGLYRLPAFSLVRRPPVSLTASIGSYYGKAVPPSVISYRTYYYNPELIYQWLNATLTKEINVAPEEPRLQIFNNRAIDFTPPQVGQRLNVYQSALSVIQTLEKGGRTANLTIDSAWPRTKLGNLNKLGIKELVSRGQSSFKGSPKNRRHNIAVGISKMKGVIIAPGEEFSFNKYLGPVEAAEGFKPELVIKAEGTIPELGGGLCQVSSTTFRAAMKAGLPITARRNHSYAVQYYAPQGTDATIYPGSADLKFINNTPGSILIWPYFPDDNTLIFDFYGTSDGRDVVLQDPVVYDRQSNGAMKANWTRIVTLPDGSVETRTFNSVYLPPALFHKHEEFVANPTSPTQTTPPGPDPGIIVPTPVPDAPPATSTSST